MSDPNLVAEYLDNLLPPEKVGEYEKICLKSDVHLAEAASVHQILSLLGQKAKVPSEAKHRMYRLIKGREAARPDRTARRRAVRHGAGGGLAAVDPAGAAPAVVGGALRAVAGGRRPDRAAVVVHLPEPGAREAAAGRGTSSVRGGRAAHPGSRRGGQEGGGWPPCAWPACRPRRCQGRGRATGPRGQGGDVLAEGGQGRGRCHGASGGDARGGGWSRGERRGQSGRRRGTDGKGGAAAGRLASGRARQGGRG